jgi:hypothetical protein
MSLIDFLNRVLQPERSSDFIVVWFVACIAVITFLLTFHLIRRTWYSVYRTIEVITSIVILYVVMISGIVPLLSRFSEHEIGVLILNTNDSSVRESLGGKRFNQALCTELGIKLKEFQLKMDLPSLGTLVQLKSVSWRADSQEEAERIGERYRATAMIWGQLSHGESGTLWTGLMHNNPLVFAFRIPGGDERLYGFDQAMGPELPLKFGEPTQDMSLMAWTVVNGFLPVMAVRLAETDPVLSAEVILRMPSADPWYKSSCEYMGLLWLKAGDQFAAADSVNKAGCCYDSAYVYLSRLESTKTSERFRAMLPPIELRQLIALSKFRAGLLAYRNGMFDRAKDCFSSALRRADSSMRNALENELRQRGVDEALFTK